ncbi:MAG: CDP-glycerol glycerophosphotransferase family protein, partial [Coprobacillus sp.]
EELRGFYLDIYKELPGHIYEQEEELLLDIKTNVYDYSFLETFNVRFNSEQSGDCAKKVIDIVFK